MRYRKNAKAPLGRPDLVFVTRRVAVFVDGCQWHGCPEHYVRPRSNRDFWDGRLRENTNRDARQTKALEHAGWRVLRFWEHEVFEALAACVQQVIDALGEDVPQAPALRYHVVRVDDGAIPDHETRWLRELRTEGPDRIVERQRSTKKWKLPNS